MRYNITNGLCLIVIMTSHLLLKSGLISQTTVSIV